MPQLNLVLAWLWIVLGFLSGLHLGLRFHEEKWMGGYSSFPRRLYRLGHISFFGTALMNLMFYFTINTAGDAASATTPAAWCFIAGAISMPACCLTVAHWPRWRLLFAVPVLSLLSAGVLTFRIVLSL